MDHSITTKLGALSLLRMSPFLEVSRFPHVGVIENILDTVSLGGDIFPQEVDSLAGWKDGLGIVEDATTAEGLWLYGSGFILKMANINGYDNSRRSKEMTYASQTFWEICDAIVNDGDGFLYPEYRDVEFNLASVEIMWQERDISLLATGGDQGSFEARVNEIQRHMEKRKLFARIVAECGGWV